MIIIPRTRSNIDYQDLAQKSLQEKLPYLLLGASVLVVLYLIFVGFFSKSKLLKSMLPTPTTEQQNQTGEVKKYIVKKGDHLWKIAEETYGSGYNAYDIAKANNIKNPSLIEPGQELVLPSVAPKMLTKGEVAGAATTTKITITGDKYTVVHGDYLWKIAIAAYGDGYAWVRIANANHLVHPDLIHAGNVLVLPR